MGAQQQQQQQQNNQQNQKNNIPQQPNIKATQQQKPPQTTIQGKPQNQPNQPAQMGNQNFAQPIMMFQPGLQPYQMGFPQMVNNQAYQQMRVLGPTPVQMAYPGQNYTFQPQPFNQFQQ